MRYVQVRHFWIIGCICLAQCSEEPAARDGVREVDHAKHWSHWSHWNHWNHPGSAEDAAPAKEIDAGVTPPPEEPPPAQADAGGNNSGCNTVQMVYDDMTQEPEALTRSPWQDGHATIDPPEVGNNPPSWANALTGWGEVYRDTTDANDTNTKVEIRNMRVYVLSKATGQWKQHTSTTGVGYGGYTESYSGSAPLYDVTTESDGGVAALIPHGSVFHFWPDNGNVVKIDTGDIGGIFVTAQAKLLVADPSHPDDRAMARYTVDMGADYYGNGQCCAPDGEVGMGRAKLVTTSWRWFNFITVPPSQIFSNPPPLDCKN
jgi:hypothetical protein